MPENLRKVDHIGIAVADLGAAVAAFQALFGAGPSAVEDVPGQKVRTVFFAAGETHVELLSPLSEESPISNFLAKRGPGIHHVCFEVGNLERALQECASRGLRLLDATPRQGAGGKRVVFLHPKSTGGILVELSEQPRPRGCDPHPREPHGSGST